MDIQSQGHDILQSVYIIPVQLLWECPVTEQLQNAPDISGVFSL